MISAWRRFLNKSDIGPDGLPSNGTNGTPPGIQKLDRELQRKFAKGVNYNMKVVIKGDAKVGKTSLFLRLKGYGFEESYSPTENLNVTSINWNYKATDDVVKIDLWEVIDSNNRKRVNFVDLKLENGVDPTHEHQMASHDKQSNGAADFEGYDKKPNASKITITNTIISLNGKTVSPLPESDRQSLAELSLNFDVFKGADAVLLVFDMTKLWTFKYVKTELPKIPKEIPVLIIANHRDQGHHRTVSAEQIEALIDGLDRSPCDGVVMYFEASMKNGFGLKLIEKFFNVPFLKLQEASLVKQLEINRCGFVSTLEELKVLQELTNKEYEQYIEQQNMKRRQQADAMSPVNSGIKQLDESMRDQIRNSTVSSNTIDNSNVKSIESKSVKEQSDAKLMASQKFVNDRLASIVIGAKNPLPESKSLQLSKSQFQQEPNVEAEEAPNAGSDDSDDEEVPRANPLVAGYQSDLDSDDQVEPKP